MSAGLRTRGAPDAGAAPTRAAPPTGAATRFGGRAPGVAIVVPSLHGGGAERVTVRLAGALRRLGWRTTLVTLEGPGTDHYPVPEGVVRVALHRAGASGGTAGALRANLGRVRALRATLREADADVAIGMMATCSVLVALATLGTGIAAVGAERIHPPRLPLGRAWETARRLAYPRLDAVVALTERSAEWLRRHARARRVVVIPNAVQWPLPELAPAVEPARWLGPADRLVLAIGRLDAQKGFDVLLRAFARMRDARPGWRLAILGDGPQRAALEGLGATLGLGEALVMPGRVGNVGAWLARADVYALSSRFEGFPNTLVEAMSAGLACVATDCETGPREIVTDGVDGLLVPVDDEAALLRALDALAGDAALRARLGARAGDARARFDEARIDASWAALADALVRDGGRR